MKLWMSLVGIALISMLLTGCDESRRASSSRASRPARPKPTVMKVLRDVRPNYMTLVVGPKAEDVEGDGQADLISVSAMLFDEPRPEPVIVDGSFTFEATPLVVEGLNAGDLPRFQWHFDASQARAAQGPTMFGFPGFRFKLDIRQHSTTPLPSMAVNVTGSFQPDDGGPPIRCVPDQRIVRIGGMN